MAVAIVYWINLFSNSAFVRDFRLQVAAFAFKSPICPIYSLVNGILHTPCYCMGRYWQSTMSVCLSVWCNVGGLLSYKLGYLEFYYTIN